MSAWLLNPPAPCAEMVTGHGPSRDRAIDLADQSPAVPPLYNLSVTLTPAGYLGQPDLLAYPEAEGTWTLQRDQQISFDQGGSWYSIENRMWRWNPELTPPPGPWDIEEPPYDWFDRLAADQQYRRFFEPQAIWRSAPISLGSLWDYRWQLLYSQSPAHGVAKGNNAGDVHNYTFEGDRWTLMYGPAWFPNLHSRDLADGIAPQYLFWRPEDGAGRGIYPMRSMTFRGRQATWDWLTPGRGGPPGGLHREFWEFPDEITITPAWW